MGEKREGPGGEQGASVFQVLPPFWMPSVTVWGSQVSWADRVLLAKSSPMKTRTRG